MNTFLLCSILICLVLEMFHNKQLREQIESLNEINQELLEKLLKAVGHETEHCPDCDAQGFSPIMHYSHCRGSRNGKGHSTH